MKKWCVVLCVLGLQFAGITNVRLIPNKTLSLRVTSQLNSSSTSNPPSSFLFQPNGVSHHDVKQQTSAVVSLTKINIISSSASISVNVRSTVSLPLCVNTTLGRRTCDEEIGLLCHDILQTRNNTTVAKPCSIDRNKINEKVERFFLVLKANGIYDKKCIDSLKWLFCSVVYPKCNATSTLYDLPCQECCLGIQNRICEKQWTQILRNEDVFFKTSVIPDCSVLPKKTGSVLCSFPQFITNYLNELPDKNNKKSKFDRIFIYGGIGLGAIILVVFAIVSVRVVRHKQKKQFIRTLSLHDVKTVHRVTPEDQLICNAVEVLGAENPKFTSLGSLIDTLGITLFGKENLEFDQNLGEGAFGKVVKCKTKNIQHSMNVDMVAVKYLKENAEVEMEHIFQRELEILSNFNHPNVIPLVGVCLDAPMCIILEFMKYGDLNEYIRLRSGSYHAVAGSYGNLPDGVEFQSPELSFHNLLSLTSQIADGVSYLASKRFVHRDIATRNILVGENLRVKISDFGLAHDIYGSDYYRISTQKMLPLRWLSPEALNLGKFTVYSDIYAFGVTMWEIFTYGMQPYYGLTNEEVCYRVRCHKTLERPYCCPQNIYALMKVCWKFEPRARKDCSFIRETINTWLQNEEPFIQESWKRIMLPPLTERRPTILKSKTLHRIIKRDITL